MTAIVFLTTLLLGFIGTTNAQNGLTTSMGEKRLAWAPEEGCIPFASHTYRCPMKMDCFPHKGFKNGGYCSCNPLFMNTPKLLPFDDSEWDDGFDSSDCTSWSFAKFAVGAYHFYCVIWSLALLHTDVLVFIELYRQKALKWNATTYALFFTFIGGISQLITFLIYFLASWDLEPEYFYNRRWMSFLLMMCLSQAIVDMEIGVTWIDFVDRTHKMSKSSSKALKILLVTMRTIGLGMAGMNFYGITSGKIGSLLQLVAIQTSVTASVLGVAGFMIVRTICPNLSDTANPNWKVAKSIQRTATYGILGKVIQFVGLLGMLFTNKNPTLSYTYGWFNALCFWGLNFTLWAYMGYIIAGNRKHLKKYDTDSVSGYFGLSTIGLNKTITRASSAFASSAFSGRSSAAPSTMEKD
jgi:hypothetical protein